MATVSGQSPGDAASGERERRHLFVIGLPRSGTTVLAHLINEHPRVVLGMERYKGLWTPNTPLAPAHFEEHRFFDFADGLTNITPDLPRWEAYYARAREKFPSATYVGDKMLQPRYVPGLRTNFPRARFVFIVRDLLEIAHSWEQRAADPHDTGWLPQRDALSAVKYWNRALRVMLAEHRARPDLSTFIEHRTFFGSLDQRPIEQLLARLELSPDTAVESTYRNARETYVTTIAGRDRALPDDLRDELLRRARSKAWQAVTRLSGVDD